MKRDKIIISCLMILSFIITAISFLFVGDVIPIHYGITGEPNRYGSKYVMLIFPGLISIIGLTMLLICKYAKLTENYIKYTLKTGVIIESVFILLSCIFIIQAIRYSNDKQLFDVYKIILFIFGVMFILMANFMPKIEKNRTLGFKIKWSMYNEVTWQKTHRFVGFIGIICGILMLLSSLFVSEIVGVIVLMILIFVFMIASYIASYRYYKQEINKTKSEE